VGFTMAFEFHGPYLALIIAAAAILWLIFSSMCNTRFEPSPPSKAKGIYVIEIGPNTCTNDTKPSPCNAIIDNTESCNDPSPSPPLAEEEICRIEIAPNMDFSYPKPHITKIWIGD
jgi:hypothetical protein